MTRGYLTFTSPHRHLLSLCPFSPLPPNCGSFLDFSGIFDVPFWIYFGISRLERPYTTTRGTGQTKALYCFDFAFGINHSSPPPLPSSPLPSPRFRRHFFTSSLYLHNCSTQCNWNHQKKSKNVLTTPHSTTMPEPKKTKQSSVPCLS